MRTKRRFFVPEVIQTSNLDCGPAALKCLLEGYGRHVSYGRLREACQTGIDGTSIDALETVSNQLGLAAEQVMLPAGDLFLPESRALPALIVVKLPSGLTHFVIAWRRHGRLLQVMDPACGRRWVGISEFTKEIYQHTIAVAAEDWREFAASSDFQAILRARLRSCGLTEAEIDWRTKKALDDSGWRGLAALDAGARLASAQVSEGELRKGTDCVRLLDRVYERPEEIPAVHRQTAKNDRLPHSGELLMRGAVLLRVRDLEPAINIAGLSPELAAAITERPASPARELLAAASRERWLIPLLVAIAGTVAAGMIAAEALLLKGLFGNASSSTLTAIACLLLLILLLEVPALSCSLRLGRQTEILFRDALLKKLPRIADRYFHSRLISDMAERSHLVHRLRNLAPLTYQLLRTSFEIMATAAAVIWLDPSGAVSVIIILAAAFIPLFFALPLLNERDLRLRTHTGALTRFYLDAMLGLTAIRAQSAERSIQHEHAKLLGEWTRAARRFHLAAAVFEAVQLTAAFALVARFVILAGTAGTARFLLLAYWALNLPALAQEFGMLARQYPYHRNLTLRLLEPLGAPEDCPHECGHGTLKRAPRVAFRGISVEISGRAILEDVDLTIESGEHVAVVGASGAGKSSLAGVLLGWFQPSAGEVLVDGQPLDPQALRPHTAWVDPAVQLWNRPLRSNLTYGSEPEASAIPRAIDGARLRPLLQSLPKGLATSLGEGGGLVSGGEAQRVRFARALLRQDVRLVILDEPFRGLDREQRHELLARARDTWSDCTLLCITHDIADTQSFDRIVIIDGGRIVEQGSPGDLRSRSESRYAQLLASETQVRKLWQAGFRRHVRVEAGAVQETGVEIV